MPADPSAGLILRDLAVASELPTFLDPSAPQNVADADGVKHTLQAYIDPSVFVDLPPIPADVPLRPLINIHKFRSIANVIQKVMTFKELADCYHYEPDLAIYRKCLSIRCLPTHMITRHSLACEK